jgi:hypothetical protein
MFGAGDSFLNFVALKDGVLHLGLMKEARLTTSKEIKEAAKMMDRQGIADA